MYQTDENHDTGIPTTYIASSQTPYMQLVTCHVKGMMPEALHNRQLHYPEYGSASVGSLTNNKQQALLTVLVCKNC